MPMLPLCYTDAGSLQGQAEVKSHHFQQRLTGGILCEPKYIKSALEADLFKVYYIS